MSRPSSQYWPDVGPIEAANDIHERRLAGARRAHQRDHLALLDRKRHAAQHRHVDFAQVVRLVNIFEVESTTWRAHCCGRRLPPKTLGENGSDASSPPAANSSPTTTCAPSCNPSAATSVWVPSLNTVRTFTRPNALAFGDPQRGFAGDAVVGFGFRTVAPRPARGRRQLRRQTGGGQSLGRRLPAQRGVGHDEHFFVASHFELQVGREIRKQPAVRVVGVHDHRVRDDVLIHARVEPRLIGATTP